jgi:hypothetical protein
VLAVLAVLSAAVAAPGQSQTNPNAGRSLVRDAARQTTPEGIRDANADLKVYIDTAVEVKNPEGLRAVLDELRTALDSTTNEGLWDLQTYARDKLDALENPVRPAQAPTPDPTPGLPVHDPAWVLRVANSGRKLVRNAASQTTADGIREANLDLKIYIDTAVEVKNPEGLRAVLGELRTTLHSTDNEGLWDLERYAQDKLEMLENPLRHTVRSHYQEQGEKVTGTEFGPTTILPLHKEALTLMRAARVGELVRSLAYVNTLRPGTGVIPEGSFIGMSPSESLTRLEVINTELPLLRLDETFRDSPTNRTIAALEAERDRLLATSGAAPGPGFVQARAELLQSLRAGAQVIAQRHEAYTRAQAALSTAHADVFALNTVSPYGDIIPTSDLAELDRRLAIKDRAHRQMVATRDAYLLALNGNALLTTSVEIDGFDEGPLWQVLNGIDASGDPALDKDKTAQAAIDVGLVALEGNIRTEIVRIGELATTGDLMTEFGTPLYDPLRSRLVAELGPIYGPNVIGSMMTAVRSGYLAHETEQEFYNRIFDSALLGAQAIVVAGIFLFPPSAVVLVPVEVGLASFQVGVSGGRILVTWIEQDRAEGVLAAGGSVTHTILLNYEDLLKAQYLDFVLTAALAPLDFKGASDALRYAHQLKAAARESAEATVRAADEAFQAGARPLIRQITDADSILARIDTEALNAYRRAWTHGAPGDASFFRSAGLAPQRTVKLGGTDFHVSAPFRDPEGKLAVIAFQETAAGKVVPRTFYFSNEHSVWRAATGVGNGVVQKGPFRIWDKQTERFLTPAEFEAVAKRGGMEVGYPFVNESAVDLAGELQGPLTRWANETPLVPLADPVRNRAFFGHLEEVSGTTPAQEFNAFVKAEDVVTPLAGPGGRLDAGLRPDPTPLDRWEFVHPLYGRSEGFLYRSQDGSTLYTVVRPSTGDVFVPSIQQADAAITPFGTRSGTYGTSLNSTPLVHNKAERIAGQAHPPYVPNESFRNPLNDFFRQQLPPAGSGGVVPDAVLPGPTVPSGRRFPVPWLVIPGLLDVSSASTSPPSGLAFTGGTDRYVIHVNPGEDPAGLATSPGMINLPIFPFRPVAVPAEAGGGTLVPIQTTPETWDAIQKAIENDKRFGFFEPDRRRKMERDRVVEP